MGAGAFVLHCRPLSSTFRLERAPAYGPYSPYSRKKKSLPRGAWQDRQRHALLQAVAAPAADGVRLARFAGDQPASALANDWRPPLALGLQRRVGQVDLGDVKMAECVLAAHRAHVLRHGATTTGKGGDVRLRHRPRSSNRKSIDHADVLSAATRQCRRPRCADRPRPGTNRGAFAASAGHRRRARRPADSAPA